MTYLIPSKFPARINVSIELTGQLLNTVRRLNAIVTEQGDSVIDFHATSPHIPHVTLLMGEVPSRISYEKCVAATAQFSNAFAVMDYTVSPPYAKEPSKQFLFLDAIPADHFMGMRRSLHSLIGRWIECEHHGGPENVSHITVGYCNSPCTWIAKLQRRFAAPSARAEYIQICEAGLRGTCIRRLAHFGLRGSNA